jgi:hypothetical protein
MSQDLKQAAFIKRYNPCSLQEISNLLQESKILQKDTSTPKQHSKCLLLSQESTQVVTTPRPRSGPTNLLARKLVIALMPLYVHSTIGVISANSIQTFARADLPKETRVIEPGSMVTKDFKPDR